MLIFLRRFSKGGPAARGADFVESLQTWLEARTINERQLIRSSKTCSYKICSEVQKSLYYESSGPFLLERIQVVGQLSCTRNICTLEGRFRTYFALSKVYGSFRTCLLMLVQIYSIPYVWHLVPSRMTNLTFYEGGALPKGKCLAPSGPNAPSFRNGVVFVMIALGQSLIPSNS